MTFGRMACLRTPDLFGGMHPRTNAVWYADSVEGVSGQCKSGELLSEFFDASDAFEMTGSRLRHRALPAIDSHGPGLGSDAENLAHFALDGREDLLVAPVEDFFVARSPQENTDDGFVRLRPMRKLVVHERASQQSASFASRHEKSEAEIFPGQCGSIMDQCHRDRRTVFDSAQFRRDFGMPSAEQLAHGVRGRSKNHAFEVLA